LPQWKKEGELTLAKCSADRKEKPEKTNATPLPYSVWRKKKGEKVRGGKAPAFLYELGENSGEKKGKLQSLWEKEKTR